MYYRVRIFYYCILWCLITIAVASPAWGSPASTFGLSSRSSAMAGAMTAVANDHTAAYYNPAALACSLGDDKTFQAVVTPIYTIRDFQVTDTTQEENVLKKNDTETKGVGVGLIVNIGRLYKSEAEPLNKTYLGISAYIPQYPLVITVPKTNKEYFFPLYDEQGPIMCAFLGIGYRINDKISIGVGANILMDVPHTDSDIEANLNLNSLMTDPAFLAAILSNGTVDVSGFVTPSVAVNRELAGKLAPHAGLIIDPLDSLRIGLSFRNKMGALASGVQPIHVVDESGNELYYTEVPIAYYAAFSPREYSLGIGISTGSLLTDLDITYSEWSGYKGPHYEKPPEPFKNTWNPKIGLEYYISENMALRGGYAYRPTPVPEQTGETNFLDADTHIFCGGFAYQIGSRKLEAHCQHHLWKDQEIDKEGSLPDIRYKGSLWNVGLSYIMEF